MKMTGIGIILAIIVLGIFSVANSFSDNKNNKGEMSSINDAQDTSKDVEISDSGQRETITLAGGCFWCMEAYYQEQKGVVSAVSGFAGGSEEDASYLKVVGGKTGHREVVQVTFDPNVISTKEVIDSYWTQFDPTDEGGSFADRGFQYTTAIFYHDDGQKKLAEESLKRLEESGLFDAPIATQILPFSTFFEAEEYHQDYYLKASEHYERYAKASGRKGFIEDTWAKDAAIEFLSNEVKKEEAKAAEVARGDYDYTDEEIADLLENLDPLAYHVVSGGTEEPFNNAYWDNKADGIYVDIITGKPIFSSTHKYDSGTGWPSFWRTIDDDSVELKADNSLGLKRTEIRSDAGHLGHLFNDGPVEEGGRRFCTNSASLLFVPLEEMGDKGYGKHLRLFDI